MISSVRMRRGSVFSQWQQPAAKTRGDPEPPFSFGGGMTEEGTVKGGSGVDGGRRRRKQINTGEQEGPANERTDAKSSTDQRRDALQSSPCVFPLQLIVVVFVVIVVVVVVSIALRQDTAVGSRIATTSSRLALLP